MNQWDYCQKMYKLHKQWGPTDEKFINKATSLKIGGLLNTLSSHIHTCSLEQNKKLWSPPQMILVTVYCFESDKERQIQHVSWLTFYNSESNTHFDALMYLLFTCICMTWCFTNKLEPEYVVLKAVQLQINCRCNLKIFT